MGITVRRSGTPVEEQFFQIIIDKALADCAARSPPGANVVVRIPLAGGHELRIDGAPEPKSWTVRVTDAGTVVEEGTGKPPPSVLVRWRLNED